jgi:Icc-related predicted phosphoesterase
MRVHVVSDIHGRSDALAAAGDGADALLVLGDLVLFIDYADHGRGIMADLFGPEAVARYIALRTARRYDEARAFTRSLWGSLGETRMERVIEAVRAQYAELFAAIPTPAYLTYGNVDVPRLWPEFARDGHQVLDGQTVRIGERTFGFVGGGLPSPMRTPNEVPEDVYAEKVAAVGTVDVLCCHIPPAVPELCYDVVAKRFETGSSAVLDAIAETSPRLVLFGHVHQPLQRRLRLGRTECVNVGHFRATGTPYVLRW